MNVLVLGVHCNDWECFKANYYYDQFEHDEHDGIQKTLNKLLMTILMVGVSCQEFNDYIFV